MCIFGQAESTPSLQNSSIPQYVGFICYLLKNYHSKICRKSFSQEKRLANASSIAPCRVCPRFNAPYNSRQAIYYVQLRIAQCQCPVEFENLIVSCLTLMFTCLLLELKSSEGLRIEYLNSEMTFKDVSGKLPSTAVLATSVS